MKPTILLVMDDLALRAQMVRTLEADAYEVRVAANHDEARAIFDTAEIGVLLLDADLRGASGWSIFTELLGLKPPLCVVLMTEMPSRTDAVDSLGADAWLEKPVSTAVVRQTVRELLAKRSAASRAPTELACFHFRHAPRFNILRLQEIRARYRHASRAFFPPSFRPADD